MQEYLDRVYIDNFEEYYLASEIMQDITKEISLGIWIKNELFDNYDSVAVIPSSEINEYLSLIDKKRFNEANELMLNISNGKYQYALRDNAIVVNPEYIIIDYIYDSDMGLLFKEKDINAIFI